MFTAARLKLGAHEAAKQRYLYVPIPVHDVCLLSAHHAPQERHEIDELIEVLQALDPAGAAWVETTKTLSEEVHHHLREEEREFFQISGKILTDPQITRLAGRYRKDQARMLKVLGAA